MLAVETQSVTKKKGVSSMFRTSTVETQCITKEEPAIRPGYERRQGHGQETTGCCCSTSMSMLPRKADLNTTVGAWTSQFGSI
jgi:predicted neutral ceramidase superfamily lipid hydrolase